MPCVKIEVPTLSNKDLYFRVDN